MRFVVAPRYRKYYGTEVWDTSKPPHDKTWNGLATYPAVVKVWEDTDGDPSHREADDYDSSHYESRTSYEMAVVIAQALNEWDHRRNLND